MTIKIDFTDQICNIQYAPLAVLSAHYQQKQVLEPLRKVTISQKKRDFEAFDKLCQVLMSILCGCETLTEVNTKLGSEIGLAQIWSMKRMADQSTLSRSLDALSLKQIGSLQEKIRLIGRRISRIPHHDWRSFLWLDFDLSGLPCSKRAEA